MWDVKKIFCKTMYSIYYLLIVSWILSTPWFFLFIYFLMILTLATIFFMDREIELNKVFIENHNEYIFANFFTFVWEYNGFLMQEV